jgi:hypothetical protein
MKIRKLLALVVVTACSLFLAPGKPATADPPEEEAAAAAVPDEAEGSAEAVPEPTAEQKEAEVPANKLPKAEREALEAANAAAELQAPSVEKMGEYADGVAIEAARIDAARTAGAEVLP